MLTSKVLPAVHTWIKDKNETLHVILRFISWIFDFGKRHPNITFTYFLVLFVPVAIVYLEPRFSPYTPFIVGINVIILMFGILGMAISFARKMLSDFYGTEKKKLKSELAGLKEQTFENSCIISSITDTLDQKSSVIKRLERSFETYLKDNQALFEQITSSLQSQEKIKKDVTSIFEKLKKSNLDVDDKYSLLTEFRDSSEERFSKVSNALGELEKFATEAKAEYSNISERLDSAKEIALETSTSINELCKDTMNIETQISPLLDTIHYQSNKSEMIINDLEKLKKEKINQNVVISKLHNQLENTENLTECPGETKFQLFNRKLRKEHLDKIHTQWLRKLNLKLTASNIMYIAQQINTLETNSKGRLATSIEDIILRILVANSVKSKCLNVLEIGTLFGLGLASIHVGTRNQFSKLQLTAIDPLEGYYGDNTKDITGEFVNEKLFHKNLQIAEIPTDDYELIKFLSTDDEAIEAASKKTYDILIIDSDHSLSGVKADFVNYACFVKRGGYIIFDDYSSDEWPDVKKFVDQEVMIRPELAFVGASWRTAVFRITSKFAGQL